MIISNKNIEILNGTSKELSFTVLDSNLNPVDLTSKTGLFKAILNNSDGTTTEAISKVLTISAGSTGKCSILLDNDDTTINVNSYYFYLLFNYGTDDDRILGDGSLNILGNSSNNIAEIKKKYNIDFKDYIMQNAIDNSNYYINLYLYSECDIEYSTKRETLDVANYVADSNFDGTIDVDDIQLIQYMTVEPFTVTDLHTKISSIKLNLPTGRSYIYLDDEYPSTDSTKLKLTYHRACFDPAKHANDFERVEQYLMFIYLFTNLTIGQLQRGILTRDINGVNVTFEIEAIKDLVKSLKTDLNMILFRLNGGPCSNISCNGKDSRNFRSILINKGY
jgi:hypothetical protein